jgi:mono/diheme cytochrome c family protein
VYTDYVVRLSVCILLAVAACDGEIDQGAAVEGLSPSEQLARAAWIKQALPALKSGTCNTCHAGQMAPLAPPYLLGMTDLDIRDTMVASIPSVVSLTSPKTSPVLLKGMHEGPALAADQISGILAWITFEHDARGSSAFIDTDKVPIAPCEGAPLDATCATPTSIDLTVGSPGSTITFFATQLGSDLYVQQLVATAGPSGLKLTHPIFKTWPAMGSDSGSDSTDGRPDANDTFYNVAIDIAAGTKSTLAATTSFVGFSAGDPISIQFDELGPKQ